MAWYYFSSVTSEKPAINCFIKEVNSTMRFPGNFKIFEKPQDIDYGIYLQTNDLKVASLFIKRFEFYEFMMNEPLDLDLFTLLQLC